MIMYVRGQVQTATLLRKTEGQRIAKLRETGPLGGLRGAWKMSDSSF